MTYHRVLDRGKPLTCTYSPQDEPDRGRSDIQPRSCWNSQWSASDDGLCVLHAEQDDKPIDDIKEAIEDLDDDEVVTGAYLAGISDGSRLSFSEIRLVRADFSNSSFRGVDFSGGNFAGSDFSEANLTRANFDEDTMLSETLFINANCNSVNFSTSDLSSIRFDKANLTGAKLQHTDAPEANFDSAKLVDTKLFQTGLNDSIFRNALIEKTQFNRSRLGDANFTDAEIFNCEFIDADLSTARFNGAYIDESTDFGRQLLLEYDADRRAEPNCLLELFGVERLNDDFFGNPNTGSPPESPPESPFEAQYGSLIFWLKLRILAFSRLFTRFRSNNMDPVVSPWSNDSSQDEILSRSEDVYGSLKSAFRDSARPNRARRFNIREKETRRKRFYPSLEWSKLAGLKWSMRYGESPGWVVAVGACLFCFAFVVFLWTGVELTNGMVISFNLGGKVHFGYLFRIALFTGRRLFTFSNGDLDPQGIGSLLATLISILGKLIEAALVFTFGRRAVA